MALANALRKNGNMAGAIEVCEQGVARHPTYSTARLALATMYAEAERWREAFEHVTQVLRENPENLLARGLADQIAEHLAPSRQGAPVPPGGASARAVAQAPSRPAVRRRGVEPPPSADLAPRVPQAVRAQSRVQQPPSAAAPRKVGAGEVRGGESPPGAPRRAGCTRTVALLERWLAVLAERRQSHSTAP